MCHSSHQFLMMEEEFASETLHINPIIAKLIIREYFTAYGHHEKFLTIDMGSIFETSVDLPFL